MSPLRRTAAIALAALIPMLAVAGCGENSPTPSPSAGSASVDLSAIACATDDPRGVGELTGTWQGNHGGVYYIRQVGSCVWWFGTELDDIEPGATGQPGFANVASGRLEGARVIVEYADVPMGDILSGGGLTFAYDVNLGQLTLVEQRGGSTPYGDTVFTRIQPGASPDATPSAPPSP